MKLLPKLETNQNWVGEAPEGGSEGWEASVCICIKDVSLWIWFSLLFFCQTTLLCAYIWFERCLSKLREKFFTFFILHRTKYLYTRHALMYFSVKFKCEGNKENLNFFPSPIQFWSSQNPPMKLNKRTRVCV